MNTHSDMKGNAIKLLQKSIIKIQENKNRTKVTVKIKNGIICTVAKEKNI